MFGFEILNRIAVWIEQNKWQRNTEREKNKCKTEQNKTKQKNKYYKAHETLKQRTFRFLKCFNHKFRVLLLQLLCLSLWRKQKCADILTNEHKHILAIFYRKNFPLILWCSFHFVSFSFQAYSQLSSISACKRRMWTAHEIDNCCSQSIMHTNISRGEGFWKWRERDKNTHRATLSVVVYEMTKRTNEQTTERTHTHMRAHRAEINYKQHRFK